MSSPYQLNVGTKSTLEMVDREQSFYTTNAHEPVSKKLVYICFMIREIPAVACFENTIFS